MISTLQGQLLRLSPSDAVVVCHGVGYQVNISLQTYKALQDKTGKEVFLEIQSVYREDAALLYGFTDIQEKKLFNLLTGVNGVGMVSALILLSTFSIAEIADSVRAGNHALIQKAKGIGLKTAQRIVIDLKDKLGDFESQEKNIATFAEHPVKSEALAALSVLGIPEKTSEKWARKFLQENPDTDVETLIKNILKSV